MHHVNFFDQILCFGNHSEQLSSAAWILNSRGLHADELAVDKHLQSGMQLTHGKHWAWSCLQHITHNPKLDYYMQLMKVNISHVINTARGGIYL